MTLLELRDLAQAEVDNENPLYTWAKLKRTWHLTWKFWRVFSPNRILGLCKALVLAVEGLEHYRAICDQSVDCTADSVLCDVHNYVRYYT